MGTTMKYFAISRFAAICTLCISLVCLLSCSHPEKRTTVTFQPDSLRVLRNPCVGWGLYCEGWEFDETYRERYPSVTPANFWKAMDSVRAHEYATHLYIRILWSSLEPEEGKYAWIHNPEYIRFIEEAKKRNLKLAFRIYHATRSRAKQGTPQYVFDAGAKFSWDTGEKFGEPHRVRDAHPEDPIFLARFDKFIEAFAKEYDDPDVTDFIDGFGAGWWGEGHHINLQDDRDLPFLIDQLTGIYHRHFNHILTVYNLAHHHPDPTIISDFEIAKEPVYEQRGFLPRRDGLGSHWFSEGDRDMMLNYFFPDSPLIGEGCYWFTNPVGDTKHWFTNDQLHQMNSWQEALTVGLDDALAYHANTFDLRVPREARFWIEELPGEVQRFITHGGYRLCPDRITYPERVPSGGVMTIGHSWKNMGVGVLPNNHPNWDRKYRVAFALLDPDTKRVISQTVVQDVDPGKWIKGGEYHYSSQLSPGEETGTMLLAVSIFDTKKGEPGLELSLEGPSYGKWYPVGTVTVAARITGDR